jgi:hypothetical protein
MKIFHIRSGSTETKKKLNRTSRNLQRHFKLPKVKKCIFKMLYEYFDPKYFNQLRKNLKKLSKKKIQNYFHVGSSLPLMSVSEMLV